MLVDLPAVWLVLLNVVAWAVLHMGLAWAGTRISPERFDPEAWFYRDREWEKDGSVYEKVLNVRKWKDGLPDLGGIFAGGFSKSVMRSRSADYIQRFVRETCRGEMVHWAVLASSLLFFLWNPWWAGLIMVVYAVMANMPCIIAQRYNRFRLLRLLGRMSETRSD